MARVKHPDVFFGTFPVAPILTNFGTQGSNPYKYVYARAVRMICSMVLMENDQDEDI